MSFARVSLMGNLGGDPEKRFTPNGAANVRFTMAVSPPKRNGEEGKPTWYTITAWDKQAEAIEKMVSAGHIVKGRPLYVEGKLEPRSYTNQNGQQATSFDVTLTAWDFVGGGRDQQRQDRTPVANEQYDDVPF